MCGFKGYFKHERACHGGVKKKHKYNSGWLLWFTFVLSLISLKKLQIIYSTFMRIQYPGLIHNSALHAGKNAVATLGKLH